MLGGVFLAALLGTAEDQARRVRIRDLGTRRRQRGRSERPQGVGIMDVAGGTRVLTGPLPVRNRSKDRRTFAC